MTKHIFSALSIAIMLIHFNNAYSQSSAEMFNKAKFQYENANYMSAIQNLKALEKSIGANPKIQSLLVYAYVASDDFVNAKIELIKYKRMVPYSSSQAHKDLLDQEKSINHRVNTLEKEHHQKIMDQRMSNAKKAISSTYDTKERRQIIEKQKLDAQLIKNKESELAAYHQMLQNNDENSAREFFYNFPNSPFKSEAYILWQKRFITSASNLQDEQAISKLKTFTSTFSSNTISNDVMQNVNKIYNQKWTDAYNKYNSIYLDNKSLIRKKETKSWTNLILYSGLMYGVGYGLEKYAIKPDEPQNYGAIMAGSFFVFSLIIEAPWNAAKSTRKRNVIIYQKVREYSTPQNLR